MNPDKRLPDIENNAIVRIDKSQMSNKTLSRNGGSKSPANLSATLLHELLDHGIPFAQGRNIDPKYTDKTKEVKYHNLSIRSINKTTNSKIQQRDGKDH